MRCRNYDSAIAATIANNLILARKIKHVPQFKIAKFLGVSAQQISKYERLSSKITVVVLDKIASFYGMSAEDFLINDIKLFLAKILPDSDETRAL